MYEQKYGVMQKVVFYAAFAENLVQIGQEMLELFTVFFVQIPSYLVPLSFLFNCDYPDQDISKLNHKI